LKKILLILLLLIPSCVNAFSTNAKSAILMDMDSHRIIYGKDIHRVQSVASISKVMTCIVAIENANINKKVVIGDEILKAYGSGVYIRQGEEIKLEDLLYGLMLRSGNDAALAIASHVAGSKESFVFIMNEVAHNIGMKNSNFVNPSGLEENDGSANMSTAYDMALLMRYAMQNEDFRRIKHWTGKSSKAL